MYTPATVCLSSHLPMPLLMWGPPPIFLVYASSYTVLVNALFEKESNTYFFFSFYFEVHFSILISQQRLPKHQKCGRLTRSFVALNPLGLGQSRGDNEASGSMLCKSETEINSFFPFLGRQDVPGLHIQGHLPPFIFPSSFSVAFTLFFLSVF